MLNFLDVIVLIGLLKQLLMFIDQNRFKFAKLSYFLVDNLFILNLMYLIAFKFSLSE